MLAPSFTDLQMHLCYHVLKMFCWQNKLVIIKFEISDSIILGSNNTAAVYVFPSEIFGVSFLELF